MGQRSRRRSPRRKRQSKRRSSSRRRSRKASSKRTKKQQQHGLRLVRLVRAQAPKKWMAIFDNNGKTYHRWFGAQGYEDYTMHKDRERMLRYRTRHRKDLRTGDPMRAGYLSYFILWNKPSLEASVSDFRKRLAVYNKTGSFPVSDSRLSAGAPVTRSSSRRKRKSPERRRRKRKSSSPSRTSPRRSRSSSPRRRNRSSSSPRKRRKTKQQRSGFSEKYVPNSLTASDRRKQTAGLREAVRSYKKGVFVSRPKVKSYPKKGSPHVRNVKRMYGVDTVRPENKTLARLSGCSARSMRRIVRKGRGAYYSSGSRPNQTSDSWAFARLASSLTGGPASCYDRHIIEIGCREDGEAARLMKKTCGKK